MTNEIGKLAQGNGDTPEDEGQLKSAYKKLSDLTRAEGSLVSMSKQDLSLMQWMLRAVSEEHKEQAMWRMCDFCDEEEALDHVSAYYEAKDLGMDTGFNVAYMFSLTSANRKGQKNNLMAQLLDALQHGKWAGAEMKGRKRDYSNPRSPLSS